MHELEELMDRIGYKFKNEALLKTALTHSSYANECKKKGCESNERLEFLGDSVLGIIVSEYIFKNFKTLSEGELTKMRASVVCESTLCELSRRIGLGDYLMLGKGEEMSNGRDRDSILADAFEALLASVYLDGGLKGARKVVLPFVEKGAAAAVKGKVFKDYKTLLQEIVQKNKEEELHYVLKSESGPDHEKEFCVEVKLNRNVIGVGVGRSKKTAEQMAAKEALALMGHQL